MIIAADLGKKVCGCFSGLCWQSRKRWYNNYRRATDRRLRPQRNWL